MAKVKRMFVYKINEKSLYVGTLVGKVGFGMLKEVEFYPNGVIGCMLADLILQSQPVVPWKPTDYFEAVGTDVMSLEEFEKFEFPSLSGKSSIRTLAMRCTSTEYRA